MQIDFDLLKQVRETADWFLQLPEKLVAAVMGPRVAYLERRARISKSKELAELREIGKSIQQLYLSKGSIIDWANRIQNQNQAEDVGYVKELFGEVARGLDEIWLVMSETPLSNTELGAEVALQIATAKKTYEALSHLPDQAILSDRGLPDIMKAMEEMMDAGRLLLAKVDEHRRHIDFSY